MTGIRARSSSISCARASIAANSYIRQEMQMERERERHTALVTMIDVYPVIAVVLARMMLLKRASQSRKPSRR